MFIVISTISEDIPYYCPPPPRQPNNLLLGRLDPVVGKNMSVWLKSTRIYWISTANVIHSFPCVVALQTLSHKPFHIADEYITI